MCDYVACRVRPLQGAVQARLRRRSPFDDRASGTPQADAVVGTTRTPLSGVYQMKTDVSWIREVGQVGGWRFAPYVLLFKHGAHYAQLHLP